MGQWNIWLLTSITSKNLYVVLGSIFSIKKIEQGKANSIDNLKGVGQIAWNFLLSFYEAGWDELIADNKNFSFRHNVRKQNNRLYFILFFPFLFYFQLFYIFLFLELWG